ncbi:MAG: zinc-binding dehydrogenase [Turneriella sp.]|nr:zinc-binding dehydrogenase [Leptospiraceae bacterium]MCX7632607.1 zinc-binding dehydrogenase [Turneriella sp.]
MRAIPFRSPSGPGALHIESWPEPEAKSGELLIAVRAFGLNFADILARKGMYNDAPRYPFVPGYEVAGVVQATSDGVPFRTGDEVMALTHFGGYAELAVADARLVVRKPPKLSFAEAASIPVNFLTAYHALFGTGPLRRGANVLIHAGAGGVGLAAVQLARNAGCTIFATASSEQKLELLSQFGVHHAINYQTTDFEREVLRLAGGANIDVVLDSVGGAYFKKDLNLLRPNGRVVAFGAAAFTDRNPLRLPFLVPQLVSMLTLSMVDLMVHSRGFYGVNMLRIAKDNPELIAEELAAILQLFNEGKVKTFVSRQMSWRQIGEAHELLESRGSTGKIVLMVD